MKAFLVIIICLVAAVLLKVMDHFFSSRNIKSVGAKSNKESRNIPKVDITNEAELKEALKFYKGLPD